VQLRTKLPDLGELVAKRFHADGRSCSEAILVAALEYLGEPRELERMATPFAGGMRMGDHCGFFTGGLMAIGLACAGLPDGKETAVRLQREFTEDWKRSFPLLCRDMKTSRTPGGCRDIGRAAGKKLEKYLASLARDPRRVRFGLREA
jgi:hypothetical protein